MNSEVPHVPEVFVSAVSDMHLVFSGSAETFLAIQ
jgi:hypothetical protein